MKIKKIKHGTLCERTGECLCDRCYFGDGENKRAVWQAKYRGKTFNAMIRDHNAGRPTMLDRVEPSSEYKRPDLVPWFGNDFCVEEANHYPMETEDLFTLLFGYVEPEEFDAETTTMLDQISTEETLC